ncbi:MAG: hypothetical protein LC808_06920 [Actinobacteria bacterium]|nr:hypothetical protein [Actinomycetota bacterium]
MDAAFAERIMAPMRRLMTGRTTLVISHNLLTVTEADQNRLEPGPSPGRCHSGIGTPDYMCPEQVTGGNLGPAVGVWGLGLVLYEAATGIQPFDISHGSASADSHTSTLSRCELRLARPAPKIRAR